MAIYHCLVSCIRRSRGSSACAAAAYRAGEKLEYGGSTFDYTRKKGVVCSGLVGWNGTRQELWRAAENAEGDKGVPAREVLIALPRELTPEQRFQVTEDFARWLNKRYGVGVDFSIHAPGTLSRRTERNPDDTEEDARKRHETNHNHHAHIMITTRRIEPGGKLAKKKTRELDDRITGPEEILAIRQAWEAHANGALELAGRAERIDSRSLKDRGIKRKAKRHLGPSDTAKERSGERTASGDYNRAIDELRALAVEVRTMMAQVQEMNEAIEISQRIDAARVLTQEQSAQIAVLIHERDGLQTVPAPEAAAPTARSRPTLH